MKDVLETARCRLRDFQQQDLVAFARYRADPEVARYQSWSDYSLDDAERLYDKQQKTPFGEPGTWYQIAIADKQSDALLGDCALYFLNEDEVEIGFTLAPEHQGRGLAREAVTSLLTYLFGKLGMWRVLAVTDAENKSAQELLLTLGFFEDESERRQVTFKGRPGEEWLYVLPLEQFRSRTQSRS